MKTAISTGASIVVMILLMAFAFPASPEKTSGPAPYVTFMDAQGKERTQLLSVSTAADWKDKITRVEFRSADTLIELSGVFVCAPVKDDAVLFAFKDAGSLTEAVQKTCEANTMQRGVHMIFDNLRSKNETKFSPVIYTVKE